MIMEFNKNIIMIYKNGRVWIKAFLVYNKYTCNQRIL